MNEGVIVRDKGQKGGTTAKKKSYFEIETGSLRMRCCECDNKKKR